MPKLIFHKRGVISSLLFSAITILTAYYYSFVKEIGYLSDKYVYSLYFDNLNGISRQYEVGFELLAWGLKFIYNSHEFFFFICSIIILNNLSVAAGKLTKSSKIVYLLFALLTPFTYSLIDNVLRQGLALSFVLLTFGFFAQRGRHKYAFFIVSLFIGSSFHLPTGVLMSLVFFMPNRLRHGMIIWVFCMFLSYFSGVYSSLFDNIIIDRYKGYLDSSITYYTGFKLKFVLFSLLPLIMLPVIKSFPVRSHINLFAKYFSINGIFLLFNFLNYYDRFLISTWMLIPMILAGISNGIVYRISRIAKLYIFFCLSILGLSSIIIFLFNGGL